MMDPIYFIRVPKKLERENIVFDIDATLVVCPVVKEATDNKFNDSHVNDWEYSNFVSDVRYKIMNMFENPDIMCNRAEPIENSYETLKSLVDAGFKLCAVTARSKKIESDTLDMMDRLFPNIFTSVDVLGFGEDKRKAIKSIGNVSLVVDDGIHNLHPEFNNLLISNKYTRYNHSGRNGFKWVKSVASIKVLDNDEIILPQGLKLKTKHPIYLGERNEVIVE